MIFLQVSFGDFHWDHKVASMDATHQNDSKSSWIFLDMILMILISCTRSV